MMAAVLMAMGFAADEFEVSTAEDGTERIARWQSATKRPTRQEIEAAWPAVQAALSAAAAAKQAADDQQHAGVVEAKRAYTRLQTIIDGADTATVAQMRTAIKQIAIDVQHLIRAAVR